MIRLTFALRRKEGTSFEEFQRYWREEHGPLVSSHAQHLNILRYVQVHTIRDPDEEIPEGPRGKMAKPFDGVAELWFASREAIVNQSTEGQAAASELLADEKKFIDLAHSPGWFCYEVPQINPTPENIVATPNSPLVKLYFVLHHHAHQTLEEAQLYWRVNHGPIVRGFGPAIGALRYIQVHRLDDELNEEFAQSRGCVDTPFTGHAELWYDQSRRGNDTREGKRASDALVRDESKFIDFARSSIWTAKEHVFIDRRSEHPLQP